MARVPSTHLNFPAIFQKDGKKKIPPSASYRAQYFRTANSSSPYCTARSLWEGQDWVGATSLRNLMNCFHTEFPRGKGGGNLVSNRNPKIPNHPPSAVHVSCSVVSNCMEPINTGPAWSPSPRTSQKALSKGAPWAMVQVLSILCLKKESTLKASLKAVKTPPEPQNVLPHAGVQSLSHTPDLPSSQLGFGP